MLLQHLHQLQTAELLSEVSSHPAGVYAFTHALLQEVAYQSLLTSTRQADHQRVARIIESTFPSRQIASRCSWRITTPRRACIHRR